VVDTPTPPYEVGDRVYYHDMGKAWPGTVRDIRYQKLTSAGFWVVSIDPDEFKRSIDVNVTLFPSRVGLLQDKK
jgi:hypothetical protein